jgi:cyclic beta-1,2-glucan synthetase
MLNAISKTLFRVFISKKKMLEWVTAADVERNVKNDVYSYIKRMFPPLGVLYCLFILALIFSKSNLIFHLLMVIAWSFSPFIAYSISKTTMHKYEILDDDTNQVLRKISRKTWFFYETFAGSDDNHLPADNYQITPVRRIAHRTSPTNIGLYMISILAARDLGYITTPVMINKLNDTLSTLEKMDKWHGHLYNWYDTKSLEILSPKYISTVDSGNLIGYFITIKEGLTETLSNPILSKELAKGLYDTFLTFEASNTETLHSVKAFINSNSFEICGFYNFLKNLLQTNTIQSTDSIGIRDLNILINELETFFPYVNLDEKLTGVVDKGPLGSVYREMLQELDKCLINNINESLTKSKSSNKNNINNKNKNINNSKSDEALEALKEIFANALGKILNLKKNIESTKNKISSLIDLTSFVKLYDPKIGLFSIGYNVDENKLTNSYYDLLASESRITSYISVARREVPVSHWFKLGRSLALIDGYKGLVSWTGTMFEYFMPPLIMNVYGNTLLDETYKTVLRAQVNYGTGRNVPWGTSESGFYTFDLALNYQYKAFGVPELGLKRGLINDMVVSPYSTILGLPFNPALCKDNIKLLLSHGLEGDFGFFEAIDYTPERLPNNKDTAIVESFMAHHQGMILIALTNYFNKNIMIKRFHSCPVIKAGEFLLQERIPMKVLITKEHKEIIAPLEKIEYSVPTVIRKFKNLDSYLPECHLLSNGSYTLLINSRGSGYSRKDDIYLTRWREEIPSRNFGFYLFFKDIHNNYNWSSTFDPFNTIPDKYEAKFSQDKAEFFRKDMDIETHTEICVSPEDNCEIRRVTITNNSAKEVVIECTSYIEAVIANNMSDLAHPAFNNLFIRTEALKEYNSILASRRPREESGKPLYSFHTVTTQGEFIGDLEYESDRYRFIGRGNDITKAVALNHPLSNTIGAVLDPIMSLRRKIKIGCGKSETICFIIGISDSLNNSIELSKKYNEYANILRAFELAYIRSQMSSKYLNLKNTEMECYDNMISNVIYLSPLRRKYEKYITANKKGQAGLWCHGISGDIPIVLVTIKTTENIDIVKNMVKAHEYWRTKGLRIDLIILNEDESSYTQPLQNMLKDIVLASNSRDVLDVVGGIFIKNSKLMPEEDRILFYSVARIIVKAEYGSVKSQVNYINELNDIPTKKYSHEKINYNNNIEEELNLQFFNDYGGFSEKGNEYIIKLRENINTPAPWINVVSNKNFGFIVSENGSGYTWSQNSRENKLTVWTNDPITDAPSEVIYLRNEISGAVWNMTPLPIREKENYIITHGKGYSNFKHMSNGIEQNLTMLVPTNDDCVKISLVKLVNKTDHPEEISVFYYIKPVLGVSDQLTQPYIITEGMKNEEIILIKNPYNSDFSDRITFIASSLKMDSVTGDRREFIGSNGSLEAPDAMTRESLSGKLGGGFYPCCAVQSKITLMPEEPFEFVLLLGEGTTEEEILSLSSKYKTAQQCKLTLENVKAYWDELLGSIAIKTPDPSMNIMMNSWLLYQTIVCRIWARSAFYQSGGAYGFRDQLQDILSVINVMPDVAKNQILLHSSHQFLEGDVQHWWHPGTNNKGIRTKFSDDLLWLPYSVSEYVEKTGDLDILKEITNFIDDAPLKDHEDERYSIPRESETSATLYEHCIRAVERSLKFGEHGIPLMGSGDWNDGMNTVGNKGKGESVWMGWFLCTVLTRFSKLCLSMGDVERSEKYLKASKEISTYIEENAWDGQWYRRAYFDDGTPLGSSLNKECKIDSLAQSWAVISGYANKDRIQIAMQSLENYLIHRDTGLILLFTPPFDNGDLKPGYIKGYVPGVRENGGQYTHAATWVVSAFAKLGLGNKAVDYFKLINPITHTMTQMECARYKVEPYVMAADVYAVDPHIGRGGWTWYTGSSGWMYKVGLEDILGFNKNEDILTIDPCIPNNWSQYTIVYKHSRTTFNITIKNPNNCSSGVKSLSINGIDIPDKKIDLKTYEGDQSHECNVEVVIGENNCIPVEQSKVKN